MNLLINKLYHNIKNNKDDNDKINRAINDLCNNVKELTEKEIIKFLVVLNTSLKINDGDIINYAFLILSSIIKNGDYSYNTYIKSIIDNVIMKINNVYQYEIKKIGILLDEFLINKTTINTIINNNDDFITDENLVVKYMMCLLMKNNDDMYAFNIDDKFDRFISLKRNEKIIISNIKYDRMNGMKRHVLCDDILRIIFNNLEFREKHYFRNASLHFQNHHITDLENIGRKYLNKFNQKIICNYKDAKRLKINWRSFISDVNHMTNLKCLHIDTATNDHVSTYDDYFIIKLTKLEELYIGNCEITSLNHLTNLTKLSVRYCGINNDGIKNLTNIRELCIDDNANIENLNHMTDLKLLTLIGTNNIGDEGIEKLTNLEELYVSNSDVSLITNLNHMTNLKILHACREIDDSSIKNLRLEELYINCNKNITNLNHMTTLKKLCAIGDCGIDNNSIKNLVDLEEFDADGNENITNINFMTNLKVLSASTYDETFRTTICGIDDDGIMNLTKIETLDVEGNEKIKNITHMTNLKNIMIDYEYMTYDVCLFLKKLNL